MTFLLRAFLLGLTRLLVGARAQWQGCAPTRDQRIYYANHGSHLDTAVIIAALPQDLRASTHPIAALDYWGVSRLRRFIALNCLNAVLIDRSGKRTSDPLAPVMSLLKAGESLILFPEGTRGIETLGTFKSGIYHLAERFPDIDLVPVYLQNAARALPKGSLLVVPLICSLRFGTPTHLRPGESKAAFLERLRAELLALGGSASSEHSPALGKASC